MKKFINDIMTKELATITTDEDIQVANNLFRQKKIRHLPVLKDQKLVGILSLTDLQRLSFRDLYDDVENDLSIMSMLKIGQIMRSDPMTVKPADSVEEVAKMLTTVEFHALPVVEDSKLVGIVTTTDIIRHLLEMIQ